MTDTLIAMLEAACERDPKASALIGPDNRLSYAEMMCVVRRVARHVDASVAPDEAVATVLPQTPLGVAAILGCCASGRVCIVLNPAEPAKRLSAILDDTKPGAVMTDAGYAGDAAWQDTTRHLELPAALAADDAIGWRPGSAPGLDDPAFVHATSGSSGRPKSIVSSMRGMLFRATATAESLRFTPASAIMPSSLASVSAGLAFIVGTLLSGSRALVVDVARDGVTSLLRLAARERATQFSGTPPLLRTLLRLPGARDAFASLRALRIGAGSMLQSDLQAWRLILPTSCLLNHAYASTEATVIAEWYVPPDYAGSAPYVPVGTPRPEHEMAYLDDAGRVLAPGEAGELVLTSRYLALGEWEEGRLVQGRMTPVEGRPGWRAFRTGDVVRLGSDGLLRFVSRADRQIKINGVRIEPGEIEAILRREHGVTDVVIAPRERAGGTALDAFVAAPGQDAASMRETLRTRLADALPRVMRPSRVIVVQAFPMLRNKVDLLALRELADRDPVA